MILHKRTFLKNVGGLVGGRMGKGAGQVRLYGGKQKKKGNTQLLFAEYLMRSVAHFYIEYQKNCLKPGWQSSTL